MSDKLSLAVEEAGGSIHLRRGVAKILIENGRAVGVRTEPRKGEAQEVRAPIVVSAADYKKTLLSLVGPEQLPNGWVQKVKESQMAEALFSTYLGVQGDLRKYGLTAANYWQFRSYDVEGDYKNIRTSETPRSFGAYITSASLKDPDTHHHAPEGHQTLEIMTITSGDPTRWGVSSKDIAGWDYNQSPQYKENKQHMEDELIERLELAFPGVSKDIVYRESSSPITHSRFTRASEGTSYGLAATPAQFMNNRPGFRTPIQGLYLCGVSTRTGHGIVGAMESGLAAARCIAKDQGRSLIESPARVA